MSCASEGAPVSSNTTSSGIWRNSLAPRHVAERPPCRHLALRSVGELPAHRWAVPTMRRRLPEPENPAAARRAAESRIEARADTVERGRRGPMLGGPILVGSRGPALIMAACAVSAISKAGTTASQASRRTQPLSRVCRSKDVREGRPESLRIALPPSIAGPFFAAPAWSCATRPPSLFERRRTGAEHPVLRVDAAAAQRLSGNGGDYWIARFRGQ